MEAFIENYGYAFVIVGTLFGGETVLALAGFAAHRGYLLFSGVVAAGCVGNFAENQIWFVLGRRYGASMRTRYPSWSLRIDRMDRWLGRYRALAVIGVRFLAGLRTPGALAIGMSDIPWPVFMILNLAGALLWACVVSAAGYFFGTAVEALVGDLKDVELLVFAAIGSLGLAYWLWRLRHRGSGLLAPPTRTV